MVTQAVNVLARHAPINGLEDKDAVAQMGVIFQGKACRKAAANASPDELSKLVRSAVNVLKKHESPDICCDHEAMSVLHSIFDGQRCRKALRVKPQKRSELFSALRDCSETTKLKTPNVDAQIRELRMAIFLRKPTIPIRCDSEENFRTLIKAIKECPTTVQERHRINIQSKSDEMN
jgi:hypothetical protein